jgi:hypothetical protein
MHITSDPLDPTFLFDCCKIILWLSKLAKELLTFELFQTAIRLVIMVQLLTSHVFCLLYHAESD